MKDGNNPRPSVQIIGSLVAALCCFTPILAVLLGALGLGWLTGYLDYVLFPVLFIFLCLTAYGYYRQSKESVSNAK